MGLRPSEWTTAAAAYPAPLSLRGRMSVSSEILPDPTCRVVLVDARTDRREVMRRMVEGDEATAILVGEADSAAAALTVVEQERADVVVVDIRMPVSEGLAIIAALRETFPELGILVCSFDLDAATVQSAMAQGADSCLAKPVRRPEVLAALKGVQRSDHHAAGAADPSHPALPATASAR